MVVEAAGIVEAITAANLLPLAIVAEVAAEVK